MEVLSAGLIVSDIIVHPVDPGIFGMDSQTIDNITYATGGDALNVAVNLAKLGADTGIAGVIGDDAAGNHIVSVLQSTGINHENVVKSEKYQTSTSVVLCEKSGERHFLYYGKSNDEFNESMIPEKVLAQIKILNVGSAMALNGLDGNGLTELFKRAKKHGVITTLDATHDSQGKWLEKVEKAFEYTDVFIPSYDEARMITGYEKPEDMAAFMSKYNLRIFGVKLGAQGCYITNFKDSKIVPAFACDEIVDTTGAGDAFMAGFICGLLKDFGHIECALLGNAVSHFCIRHFGAAGYLPDFESLKGFAFSGNNI